MNNTTPKYICLWNPHSQEWFLFDYVYGQDKYAPTYGCAIFNGPTPEECIAGAGEMFGIKAEDVEVA